MKGYFFIADLLGFSELVNNLKHSDLIVRVNNWVSLVSNAAKECSIERYQLLSDTLFVSVNATKDDLGKLIKYARILLHKGLESSLPIRGAISHGDYEWSNLIYGEAVINAHRLEVSQEWIGVSCESKLPHVEDFWGLDSLICFPVPKKSSLIELQPVVGWDVPSFDILVRKLIFNSRGIPLEWKWGRKVRNTAEFGVYRSLLQTKGENGKVFYGRLPIEGFEIVLKAAKLITEDNSGGTTPNS